MTKGGLEVKPINIPLCGRRNERFLFIALILPGLSDPSIAIATSWVSSLVFFKNPAERHPGDFD
jgi:hypothetical protein